MERPWVQAASSSRVTFVLSNPWRSFSPEQHWGTYRTRGPGEGDPVAEFTPLPKHLLLVCLDQDTSCQP